MYYPNPDPWIVYFCEGHFCSYGPGRTDRGCCKSCLVKVCEKLWWGLSKLFLNCFTYLQKVTQLLWEQYVADNLISSTSTDSCPKAVNSLYSTTLNIERPKLDPKDLKPWLRFPQILSELKIQKRHKVCWVIPFLNLWQYTLHTAVQRARLCSKTISWTDMNHVSHYCPIMTMRT